MSLAKVIEAELIASGASPGNSLHSWRCEYPEQYGACDCVAEIAQDIVVALVASGLLTEDWKHGNASGGGSIHHTRADAEEAMAAHNHRRDNRTGYDLLEPRVPESTGIARRFVTQWEPMP